MKNKIKKVATIVSLVLGPVMMTLAQPLPPDPGGSPVPGGGPVVCPVGPGLWILLAMGISYGVSKVMQLRKEAKEEKLA